MDYDSLSPYRTEVYNYRRVQTFLAGHAPDKCTYVALNVIKIE